MFNIEAATHTVAGGAAAGIDRGTYTGGKSIHFDTTNQYLNRTWSATPTDANRWVVAVWVKRHEHGQHTGILDTHTDASNRSHLAFVGDKILWYDIQSGTDYGGQDSALNRDAHTWTQWVFSFDPDGTADGWRVYKDGVEVPDAQKVANNDYGTFPSAYSSLIGKASRAHKIAFYSGTSSYVDISLAQYVFLDGQSIQNADVAITDFGHVSDDTGKWVMTNITSSSFTYGDDGFLMVFNDDVTDDSGNANNWTANNTPTYSDDTPVDNYCTMNALWENGTPVFSNGNLTLVTNAANEEVGSTMFIDSADTEGYYLEVTTDVVSGNGPQMGWIPLNQNLDRPGDAALDGGYNITTTSIQKRQSGSNSAITGSSAGTNGEVLRFAIKNGKCWIGDAGGWFDSGDPDAETNPQFSNLVGSYAFVKGNTSTGSCTATINFGATAYTYTKPTGFKDISSANLPAPDNWKPQDNANIVLYTGDGTAIGSGGLAVTGVGFTPDLTWIKNRDAADSHQWTDIVRGVTKNLSCDADTVEGTDTEGLNTFDADGFTVGSDVSYNTSSEDYWSLNILAGGAASTNSDGSISAEVSTDGVNFSCGTYTGTGANATVGHGLASAPDLIFVKERTNDVGSWYTYHSSNTAAPETDYLALDTTAATADLNTVWNDTAPTSSVFSIGTLDDVNASGDTYVFYAFVFGDVFTGGSYEGNNNADGTFIPSDELLMVVTKSIDSTSSWYIYDQIRSTFNEVDDQILADSAAAETTGSEEIDFVSNGVKLRSADAEHNAAETFIWFGVKKNGGQLAA